MNEQRLEELKADYGRFDDEGSMTIVALVAEVERLRAALEDMLLLIEEHGGRTMTSHATRILAARQALKGGEG